FFRTVHGWLPIVSKRYFHEYLISFPAACQPEIVLLLCCMKLLTTSADGESFEPRSSLYLATRRLSNELEDMGNFSLQALQARVLLAYYELGYAIYPAAYLATGYCAKYGIALGLHSTSFQAEPTFSLDEIEQRRRTWWAILVLERFIRLGYPDHVLLTPEPSIWDNLPTDDDVWDNQVIITSTVRLTATDVFKKPGRFAILAQGAYLLGCVIRNVSRSEVVAPGSLQDDEAQQLRRTLSALLRLSDVATGAQNYDFCAQKSLCYRYSPAFISP
ncbi:hypothetical protein M431DRAFT_549711, partial [Trichoderma harzianum CBS 226.95]